MRLIDAELLKHEIIMESSKPILSRRALFGIIDDAPTIEAEPVRHGHWVNAAGENVPFDENIEGDPYCPCDSVWCSECGAWLTVSDEYFATGRYCPNCGAKMEEQE